MTEQEHISDDARAAEIETAFPGWGVWVSDTGAWWASLRSALTLDQIAAGCTPFVRAEDADELVEMLGTRERLMARTAR